VTGRYALNDALHQVVKALLLQHIEDNEDHWVDVDSFSVIEYRITNHELVNTNNFLLSVEVHDAIDPTTRVVTLRMARQREEGDERSSTVE
jgi:hypothetical protein